MTRRDPNLSEKLASALLHLLEARGEPIPHEHQKLMSVDQILSLWQWDHYPVRYENGGTTHPSNIRPLFRRAHIDVTAKVDKPASAKSKRIVDSEAKFRRRVLARAAGEKPKPSRWGSRKLQSRPFNRRANT